MALLLVGALAVGCGGGGAAGDCGPCADGCCSAAGACLSQAFQTEQACGSGGGVCGACAGGQTCVHGQCAAASASCTPACDALTQDCVGGQCVARGGLQADACGGSCAFCGGTCDANTRSCFGGTCNASGTSGAGGGGGLGGLLPASCASCSPGQPGAARQCCDPMTQLCVAPDGITSCASASTGWCGGCGASGSGGGVGIGVGGLCSGCRRADGSCVALGVGQGLSDGLCGRDGEQCMSCRDQSASCDAAQGICQFRERTWRVCAQSAVIDASVTWDPLDSYFPPTFAGLVTLGTPNATQNLTGMSAVKGVIPLPRGGTQEIWTSIFNGSSCVRGVTESALAGGTSGGVVVSIWETDMFDPDDAAGACSFRVESLDLMYGSQTIQLTQANGQCTGHVGMVAITLTPES
ncbi:MAG: hypothetical protein IPL40_06860 [Proteobacteria bacterium]|nr:hypothetical protein [Pseudomonadota bacterium]